MTPRLRVLPVVLIQFSIILCLILLAMELGQDDSKVRVILSVFLSVFLIVSYAIARRAQSSVVIQDKERTLQMHNEAMSLVAEAEIAHRREVAAWIHGTLQSSLLTLSHSLSTSGNEEGSLQIAKMCDEIVRKKAHDLYPPQLEVSLLLALQDLCLNRAELTVSPNLELSALKDFSSVVIPVDVRVAAYRIVEEGLNNALKKVTTTNVHVYLKAEGGSLQISILDNGEMMSDEPKSSLGFSLIEAYVSRCRGSWSISNADSGVLLTANLLFHQGSLSTMVPKSVQDLLRGKEK